MSSFSHSCGVPPPLAQRRSNAGTSKPTSRGHSRVPSRGQGSFAGGPPIPRSPAKSAQGSVREIPASAPLSGRSDAGRGESPGQRESSVPSLGDEKRSSPSSSGKGRRGPGWNSVGGFLTRMLTKVSGFLETMLVSVSDSLKRMGRAGASARSKWMPRRPRSGSSRTATRRPSAEERKGNEAGRRQQVLLRREAGLLAPGGGRHCPGRRPASPAPDLHAVPRSLRRLGVRSVRPGGRARGRARQEGAICGRAGVVVRRTWGCLRPCITKPFGGSPGCPVPTRSAPAAFHAALGRDLGRRGRRGERCKGHGACVRADGAWVGCW